MDLTLTIGTVVVSLSIFILFAFGAARADKAVAVKTELSRQALQAKTAPKPATKKK